MCLQAPIIVRKHTLPSSWHKGPWWLGGGPYGERSCTQEVWEGNRNQNSFCQLFREELELRGAAPTFFQSLRFGGIVIQFIDLGL